MSSPDAVDFSKTQARLLTKRQLSDMAWGVRELSKKLASIRLKMQVRTIFLLTKAHDESLLDHTREVAEWLLSLDRGTEYTVYATTAINRDSTTAEIRNPDMWSKR